MQAPVGASRANAFASPGARSHAWRVAGGVLLVLLVSASMFGAEWAGLEARLVRALVVPLLLAVVYAAFTGGIVTGVVAAGVGVAHTAVFFANGEATLFYQADDLVRVLIISSALLSSGVLIGVLRTRLDAAAARAVRVERDAARELERSNRRLRDANESLEAFSYLVSHDLKEPVRSLDALLGDAASEPDPEAKAELLEAAREANRRLRRLIEGLLDWSRIASAPVELEPIAVKELLESPGCRVRFEALARERGAVVVADDALPRVLATEALLCQTLGNLVLNAISHNPKPAPQVHVRAARADEPGFVEVLVDDNGPGLSPAVRRQLERGLDRPTTLRTGFGLLIARRATERMGGRIALGDAPGGGARVRLLLRAAG